MRRMVKEDLLTFDGKPLFPERIAETVPYELTELEQDLYEQVTTYVREGMNRAAKLDGKRRNTVGFALTVLQRRLASSPEAIYRSLERRAARLERRKQEVLAGGTVAEPKAADVIGAIDEFDDDEFTAERDGGVRGGARRRRDRGADGRGARRRAARSRRSHQGGRAACGRQTPTANGQSCARSSRTTRWRPPEEVTSGAS